MVIEGITPTTREAVAVHIRSGRIAEIRPLRDGTGRLPLLCPGFLDMQVNGVLHSDYSLEQLRAEQIRQIVERLDCSGTTQHVATIITSPKERIIGNLKTLVRVMNNDRDLAHAIAGIHIEGPFIAPEDGPRGAHDRAYIRPPDIEEARQWQDAAEGHIRLITLSPEWEKAPQFIRGVTELGIVAAIGHSAATERQIRAAVDAGASLSTHLGNGSHPRIPRLHNYIWEQLAEDRLTAGIISDGFHLPEAVLKVFARVKGMERLILVSDAAYLAGCEPGIYRHDAVEVQVHEDGHLGLPGTEILAGAGHLLDWDIPHFARVTGSRLGEILPLVTTNPAHLLGLEKDFGTLQPGAPANLVLCRHEEGLKRLQILKTIRAGSIVYTGEAGAEN